MSRYDFERCTLDTDRRTLSVGGVPADVQPLIFDLIAYFVRHPQRVIGRAELLGAVWRSPAVSDSVVARAVMKARRALGDDAKAPRLILTAARAGYRFTCQVVTARPDAPDPGPPVMPAAPAELACASDAALSRLQFERAFALERQGHWREALDLLRPCLQHLDGSGPVQLLHARLLLQCGQLDAAEQQLRTALAAADAAPGQTLRIELLIELASCLAHGARAAEAAALCDQALALADAGAAGRGWVPDVLQVQARLLLRRGDFDAAVLAAQRAVSLASALDDPVQQARARLQLASVLVFIERTDQATDAAALAAAHARGCGLLSLEAQAVHMQATLKMGRRESLQAERLARHAADLCAAVGDRAGGVSARFLRCFALLECDRIDDAEPVWQELADTPDLSPYLRPALQIAGAVLAWKRGRRDDSIAGLSALVEHGEPGTATRAPAFELLLQLLDVGRLDAAQALLERVRSDPKGARLVAATAALALAHRQRASAVETLRMHWLSRPGASNAEMDIAIDLAWLLLEDEDPAATDPLLDALAASLLDYGPDLLCAEVFRAGYRLRRAPSAETRAQWQRVIGAAEPLRLRGLALHGQAYVAALVHGRPPALPWLLSRACF